MARPSGPFLAGVVSGALVGAALAMALAPPSGEDMRNLLRAKARDAQARADGAFEAGGVSGK